MYHVSYECARLVDVLTQQADQEGMGCYSSFLDNHSHHLVKKTPVIEFQFFTIYFLPAPPAALDARFTGFFFAAPELLSVAASEYAAVRSAT